MDTEEALEVLATKPDLPSRRVKEEMTRTGTTWRQVCTTLDLKSNNSLKRRFQGETPWTLAELSQLSKHFGLKLESLLTET